MPKVKYRPKVSQPIKPKGPEEYPTKWKGKGVTTIGRGIHVLNNFTPSSVYAIETQKGVVLIDSGQEEPTYRLSDGLVNVQLRPKDVKHVLITHAHYDHVLGVNQIKAEVGATVHAGKGDAEVLRNADREAIFSLFDPVPYSGEPIAVDHVLTDGDVLDLGDTQIEAIATPGHTPGSMCYLLERDGLTYFFAGDVIASMNFGPAIYPINLPKKYRGDAKEFLETLDRLLAMPAPDRILPGHPHQHQRLESVRTNQESWEALLRPAREQVFKTVERHEIDGRDFLEDEPFSIEDNLFYLGKLDGIGIYAIQTEQMLFVVNLAGGDAYGQWVEERLERLSISQPPAAVLLTALTDSAISTVSSLPAEWIVIGPETAFTDLSQNIEANVTGLKQLQVLAPSIEAIPLDDELAFRTKTNGKNVLITPQRPRQVDLVWKNSRNGHNVYGKLLPAQTEWEAELRNDESVRSAAKAMFKTLDEQKPDIWLPLQPVMEQNVNLYDDQWRDIMRANWRVIPKDY